MNHIKPFRLYVLNEHACAWDFYTYASEDEARTHMWDTVEAGKYNCAYLITDTRGHTCEFSGEHFAEWICDVVVQGTNADVNMSKVGWPKLAA